MSKARLVIMSVVLEGRSPADTARAYGVSPSWVSKLVARYRIEGDAAFVPRSRRPHTSPTALAPTTVALIVELRTTLGAAGLDVERAEASIQTRPSFDDQTAFILTEPVSESQARFHRGSAFVARLVLLVEFRRSVTQRRSHAGGGSECRHIRHEDLATLRKRVEHRTVDQILVLDRGTLRRRHRARVRRDATPHRCHIGNQQGVDAPLTGSGHEICDRGDGLTGTDVSSISIDAGMVLAAGR